MTSVPITHATPAGFCVMQKNRGDQNKIAEDYLEIEFDVMMGGGNENFAADKREDGRDLYSEFENKNYQVFKTRKELLDYEGSNKILGVFSDEALPYAIDRAHDSNLKENTPSLAEMAKQAVQHLSKSNDEGFVLQIEGGKVDWAAHANDAAALLYDQIAFDEAIKEVMDFAEKDRETLVIITTDHGNANPGLIKGKYVDQNFSNLQDFTHTNAWLLEEIKKKANSFSSIREMVASVNGDQTITEEEAKVLLNYYQKNNGGLYNTGNLPYGPLSEMQKKYTSIGWISMDHSGDYVELAAYGPGSDQLKPFVKNYELHDFMLEVAEVEDKF